MEFIFTTHALRRMLKHGIRSEEEAVSTCVICKHGDVKPGATSLTVERGGMTLVIKGIPARVCDTCGEGYFDKETTKRIEAIADQLHGAGVEVAVRQYAA